MVRWLALSGVAVLLSVAGCSGGGESSDQAESGDGGTSDQYCSALRNAQQEFGALESGQLTGRNVAQIFDRIHGIADQAPPEVSQEWQTLDGAITQMESGLQDLGLGFEDLQDPQKLAEVDPKQLQRFGQDMQKLSGQKFERAGNKIEQHAKSECNIDLSQSGQGGQNGQN
jgi:hypothetical protein